MNRPLRRAPSRLAFIVAVALAAGVVSPSIPAWAAVTATLSPPSTLTAAFGASFSAPVKNVTAANLGIRLADAIALLPAGAPQCRDASNALIGCAAGPVSSATVSPAAPLVPGQAYVEVENPTGATPILDLSNVAVDAAAQAFRASISEEELSVASVHSWRRVSDATAFGGSYQTERAAGARAIYRFTGTNITWVTLTGPAQGNANVAIDGVNRGTFNQYAPSVHAGVARAFTGLTAAAHTFVLTVLGTKSTAATDTLVALDALRVGGTLQSTPAVTYRWRIVAVSAASGGRFARTNLRGSAMRFTFRGKGIACWMAAGPDQGMAALYVDGTLRATYDNYATTTGYGLRRAIGSLTDTVHTARIVALGTKRAASTGTFIGVDRWGVLGVTVAGAHPRLLLDPTTLTALRQRAQIPTPEWVALRDHCNNYLTGSVEWPDGNDYPEGGSIGEGYQGDGYFAPLQNAALCYQIALVVAPSTAASYAAKGADILTKMSAPDGPHAPDPLRDSGYGIRYFGFGMALAYDWLHDALSDTVRARVYTALNRWVAAFEAGGFERDFPQGNYFAGYYVAKAAAGLATEGENPQGAAHWSDWLTRVHGQMVQPYYAANLEGGGWPEGWNYGPLGTVLMSLPVLMARTAKGLDLINAPGAPYRYPLGSAAFLMHFTWPGFRTLEDSGLVYDDDNPTETPAWLYTTMWGVLRRLGDPQAPVFRSVAATIRADHPVSRLGTDWNGWLDMMFWEQTAPETPYTTLPRTWLARGMDDVAVRSSWSPDAVWAGFKGGPYTNNPDNGEEYFDKGSLSIMNGSRSFVVNAAGALQRNTPGTNDGSPWGQVIYDDLFNGSREIFNVFYTGLPVPWGQGNFLRSDGARTAVTNVEDGGEYVTMRSIHLEDEYPRNGIDATITSWTRDVVYVRPSVFVVYDRTTVNAASVPQWMAFHVARAPVAAPAPSAGVGRFDVGTGASYRGTMETVFPAEHTDSVVDVFSSHKIYRVEVRPTADALSNKWLTVFDAAPTAADAVSASRLSAAAGTVQAGAVLGTLMRGASGNSAVLAGSAAPGPVAGEVRYLVPTANTTHVLIDLAPSTSYAVTIAVSGGNQIISVSPGAGFTTSARGILAFTTSTTGTVTQI